MSPYTGGKILHPWDEKIFKLNQHKGSYLPFLSKLLYGLIVLIVPIIVVYTKFDLFIVNLRRNKNGVGKSDSNPETAEQFFNEKYGQTFESSTKDVGQIPYTVASSRFTLQVTSSALTPCIM